MPTSSTPSAGIFRQYDIRGVIDRDLTPEVARAIGAGYAALLAERGRHGAVAIGRDNRPSGNTLRDGLVSGLTASGLDVVDIGVVPTPLLYWSLHHIDVIGGIQITGSHNPAAYNGFKLSLDKSSLHGDDIQRIRQLTQTRVSSPRKGTVQKRSIVDAYIDDIVQRVKPLRRPIRAVVDCGNGVGALVAPQLFERLGVRQSALFCESDGTFPNHHPDPTVPENLQDLIVEVQRADAELGIAFDGDADRIGVVDDEGTIIWGDYLLILFARDVLKRSGRPQPVIFDVKCSQALAQAITAAGGTPVMWKTGHSLIKERMQQLDAPVAGEMSGHMFFAEQFYGHDDALYAAARLLRILDDEDRTVRELLADVPRYVSTPEIRVDCPDDRKFQVVEQAVRDFRARYQVIDVDGARVLFSDGWGLIRASNTQPTLVLRVEARSMERLGEIRAEMESWLRHQGVHV